MARVTAYRCITCKCLWNRNEDGSWSLFSITQVAEECCNNNPDFLNRIFPEQVENGL